MSTACALSRLSGWIFRLPRSRLYPLKRVADEFGGGREVVPAPMVCSIAGGAGGEVWGRLDEAAAKALRRAAALLR